MVAAATCEPEDLGGEEEKDPLGEEEARRIRGLGYTV
jgi:hypothetical protein